MAQSSSTGIKDFVKHALTSYYKNFQIKLADGPKSTDVNPAIKINNGKIYVHNVGNYNGNINNSSTLLEVINSISNNVNDINSEIIDINGRIASIPGASKMIAGNNNLTILISEDGSTYFYVEGYRYNKDTSSFAEGYEKNKANGNYSHVEGYNTYANGDYSHAEGIHNETNNIAEHAEGKYNKSHEGKTIHSIGIGESEQIRKNAFEVMQDGSIYVYGLGNYDGSTLINVSTLLDICNSKANKIINATEGHFASLDSNGNLQDSDYNYSSFAPYTHSHSEIKAPGAFANYAYARIAQYGSSVPAFFLKVGGANDMSALVEVNVNNIDNLHRALATPSSIPENNATKLITSKAVYDALIEKADKNKIEDENAGHVEVEDGEVDIDAPHGIHLHIVDESGESDVQHDVDIDASNVANLEDALASAKIPLWNNGVIPFEASNGSLVLVSDTSKYDSLFTNVPLFGAGKIYYSTRIIVDDTAVFLAICEAETVKGGHMEFQRKKKVTMFVGGYTLVIQKGEDDGIVTLKAVSSLDAVLSASVESTSQAES